MEAIHSAIIPDLKRFLVIKLADHGDAILATSATAALRKAYAESTIDVLTTSNGAIAFALCPVIDRIIEMDKHAFDSPRVLLHPTSAIRLANVVRQLRRSKYDAIVLLQHLTTSFGARKYRWLCRAIGARYSTGLDNGEGDFLTHRAIDYGFGAKSVHDYNLDVVAQLGAKTDQPHPSIAIPDSARHAVRELLANHAVDSPYVVIHPTVGPYSPARNWAPERFAEVAREISRQTCHTIILVGAGDASSAAARISASADVVNLVGKTSFAELAALLDGARLVIGADSGVAHLAAALDTRTLAIFGPSNHRAWKPYNSSILTESTTKLPNSTSFVIRSTTPCSPCFYSGFSLGRPDGCRMRTCLQEISAKTVTQIATAILSES